MMASVSEMLLRASSGNQFSELDTLLVHVTPPKVEEEPEEEEALAEGAAASETDGESEAEKKADDGAAGDGDK